MGCRGKGDRQRLASLALTTVLGALGHHPVTEERTVAQRVDLLAKFHASRERHNLDLRPTSFHCNRPPPRRWNGYQPKSTGLPR